MKTIAFQQTNLSLAGSINSVSFSVIINDGTQPYAVSFINRDDLMGKPGVRVMSYPSEITNGECRIATIRRGIIQLDNGSLIMIYHRGGTSNNPMKRIAVLRVHENYEQGDLVFPFYNTINKGFFSESDARPPSMIIEDDRFISSWIRGNLKLLSEDELAAIPFIAENNSFNARLTSNYGLLYHKSSLCNGETVQQETKRIETESKSFSSFRKTKIK